MDDTRKGATTTITNPFVLGRPLPCDLISPISVAEMLDDEKLESLCDEACVDMAHTPPPREG
jgi:hypothetical protein